LLEKRAVRVRRYVGEGNGFETGPKDHDSCLMMERMGLVAI